MLLLLVVIYKWLIRHWTIAIEWFGILLWLRIIVLWVEGIAHRIHLVLKGLAARLKWLDRMLLLYWLIWGEYSVIVGYE